MGAPRAAGRRPGGVRPAVPLVEPRPSRRREGCAAGHAWRPGRPPRALVGADRVPEGAVPAALDADGPAPPAGSSPRLVEVFGRDRVLVELWDHGDPLDSAPQRRLGRAGRPDDVGGDGHEQRPLRHPRSPPAGHRARRRAGPAQPRRGRCRGSGGGRRPPAQRSRAGPPLRPLPRCGRPGGRGRSGLPLDLSFVAPSLPPFPHHRDRTEMEELRRLVEDGGPPTASASPGTGEGVGTIDHELAMIEHLGFPGYFLVVWDIVEFCRQNEHLLPGSGSGGEQGGLLRARDHERRRRGARAAVRALPVVRAGRSARHRHRHRVRTGGRRSSSTSTSATAATTPQVANVITYRARSAVRDMAKALGHAPGQQDAWSSRWTGPGGRHRGGRARRQGDHDIPAGARSSPQQVEDFPPPRHPLRGMVICDRPVIEVCPSSGRGCRTAPVLQWDKDDCARRAGQVRPARARDAAALHYAIDLIREHRGYEVDLATIPQEDESTRCSAGRHGRRVPDRVPGPDGHAAPLEAAGVLRPRRRGGPDPARADPGRIGAPLHPPAQRPGDGHLPAPAARELPAQDARGAAVPGAADADGDRRRRVHAGRGRRAAPGDGRRSARGSGWSGSASGSTTGWPSGASPGRSPTSCSPSWPRSPTTASPRVHSVSFAYLVYASAWIKLHEPAAFCAALLNAQPMGFWSPHTLVQDARRHGVVVRTPDLNASGATATLEPCADSQAAGDPVRLGAQHRRGPGRGDRGRAGRTPTPRISCGGCRR